MMSLHRLRIPPRRRLFNIVSIASHWAAIRWRRLRPDMGRLRNTHHLIILSGRGSSADRRQANLMSSSPRRQGFDDAIDLSGANVAH